MLLRSCIGRIEVWIMTSIKFLCCKRCGHKWSPRKVIGLPLRCPLPLGCNSPYWSKDRVKRRKKSS